jgi:hypothetical protein
MIIMLLSLDTGEQILVKANKWLPIYIYPIRYNFLFVFPLVSC